MYSMMRQKQLLSEVATILQAGGHTEVKLSTFDHTDNPEDGGVRQLEVGPWCVTVEHVTPWNEITTAIRDEAEPYYLVIGEDGSMAFVTQDLDNLINWLWAYAPYTIQVANRKFVEYPL